MRAGDIVLLLDEAIVDLQLKNDKEYIGILLEPEVWTIDPEHDITSKMWQVLVDRDVHILNEFSLSPLNIQHNSLQIQARNHRFVLHSSKL